MRGLMPQEAAVLGKILLADFPGREAIREQLKECFVKPIEGDDYSLEVVPTSSVLFPCDVHMPVEAEYIDSDGECISILLHLQNHKIYEVEFLKYSGEPILKFPTPEDLTVYPDGTQGIYVPPTEH